jgi:hypothetical protein
MNTMMARTSSNAATITIRLRSTIDVLPQVAPIGAGALFTMSNTSRARPWLWCFSGSFSDGAPRWGWCYSSSQSSSRRGGGGNRFALAFPHAVSRRVRQRHSFRQATGRAQAGLITGFCRQGASDVLAIPLEAEAVDDYTSVDNPADAVGNVEKRVRSLARPDGFAI